MAAIATVSSRVDTASWAPKSPVVLRLEKGLVTAMVQRLRPKCLTISLDMLRFN
jgi:hypothetical protein